MKVLFDHQIFCMQGYGGISRYFVSLALQLEELNCQAQIFAALHKNKYLGEAKPSNVLGVGPCSYHPRIGRVIRRVSDRLFPLVSSGVKPDVIHLTYYTKNRRQKFKMPLATTCYDMIHELFSDHFPSTNMVPRLKEQSFAAADAIICISETTRRDLIDVYNVSPERTFVTYLAASECFCPSTEKKETVGRQKILFVGSRGGYKNFEGLLTAFAKSDRLKDNFQLVAYGGGSFTSLEKQLIRESLLNEQHVIQVAGGDAELLELYRDAAVFVSPSLYEGFGLPVLEAMQTGCPVISSGRGSLREVGGDATVYFELDNEGSLLHTLETIVGSDSTRAYYSKLGLERATQFSWLKCAEQTLAIYELLRG